MRRREIENFKYWHSMPKFMSFELSRSPAEHDVIFKNEQSKNDILVATCHTIHVFFDAVYLRERKQINEI